MAVGVCFSGHNRPPCLMIVMWFIYNYISVSEEKPQTPNKYFAVTSSTAVIPCVIDNINVRSRWYPERPKQASSKVSKHSSHNDPEDQDLLVYVIENVQASNTGRYICTDGSDTSQTELVVIQPLPARDVEASTGDGGGVIVKWKAPKKNSDAIAGYNIYLEDVEKGGEKKFKVDAVKTSGNEEFTMRNISHGSTYKIQVSPLYFNGTDDIGETIEGPRSSPTEVSAPQADAQSWTVSVLPWVNSSIKVVWRHLDDNKIDRYIVYYQGVVKKDASMGEVTVPRPREGGEVSVILKNLKIKQKYKIHVIPYSGGKKKIAGPRSEEVVYLHDGFNPELSIRAIALNSETVLVSVDTVGGDKVDKLRVLYSDSSATKWNKVDNYNDKDKYAVVTQLEPNTRYYFAARASVNTKARSVVTHLVTPPTGLAQPRDVTVTAKSKNSVLVSWDYQGDAPAKGFIVRTNKHQAQNVTSAIPAREDVVFNEKSLLVDNLETDEKYEVRIEPFDVENIGSCSESILFELADKGIDKPDNYRPPEFVDDQVLDLEINAGEVIRLKCTAIGNPEPKVHWVKDNVAVTTPTDNVSNLELSDVREPVLLTCLASNLGGTVERHTHVHVNQQLEPPRFLHGLPETKIVQRQGGIEEMCEATGNPVPTITWYKDGQRVDTRQARPGWSVMQENVITRPFILKCVASNEAGSVESVSQIYIQETLRKPTMRNKLQKNIVKLEGDSLVVACQYEGNPPPQVSWYNGKRRITAPEQGSNTLKLNNVWESMNLTCRGENVAGIKEEGFQLEVKPRDKSGDYKVTLKLMKESPTDVRFKWNVDKGDLLNIRRFDLMITNPDGHIVINQATGPQHRTFTVRRLQPDVRYVANLQTTSNTMLVDNVHLSFTLQDLDITSGREPALFLDIVEIRDTEARLDYWTENCDPRRVSSYRFFIKDLAVRNIGNIILRQERLPLDSTTIIVNRLKPLNPYQVTLDVVSAQGQPFLSVSGNFTTAGPGQFVEPVSVTSLTSGEPSTEQPTPTVHQEVTSTRDMGMTKRRATTQQPTITQPVGVVTETDDVTTTEMPENHDYIMTAKIPNKTPYKVDIRWAVDNGPLENIKNFTVTIKDVRGQTLLKQTLPDNQRYITIQSLTPDTKYLVNVQANGPDGVLAESDVDFTTDARDKIEDTSSPELELEANEIRANSARIDWTLVKADPQLIKKYRLQVLDDSPEGFNLLTQEMHPSSQSLNLQQLQPKTRYRVIVDALSDDGSVLMSSTLTFQTSAPNRYGSPVVGSPSTHKAMARSVRDSRQDPRPNSVQEENINPELDFELNPLIGGKVKVSWTANGFSRSRPISFYKIKVHVNGPEGQVVHEEDLGLNTAYYLISGLEDDTRYHVRLEALDRNGDIVKYVISPYEVPSAGNLVVTSSVFNSPTQPSLTTNQPSNEMVITRAVPEGPDGIRVEWEYVHPDPTRPARTSILRYHHFKDNTLLNTQILHAAPGQQEFLITNLDKDGGHGVQVASMTDGGQHVRWSKLVIVNLP